MRAFFTIVSGLLLAALGLRMLGLAKPPPPPPEATPGAALAVVCDGALELNLAPLWDNLPPSWKAAAEELVAKLQASANPALWQLGFELIERTADLAATPADQARGIDGSARLARLLGVEETAGAPAPAAIQYGRARLAAALRTVAESGLDDPDNLAYLNLRELARGCLPAVEQKLGAIEGHAGEKLLEARWQDLLAAAATAGREAPPDQSAIDLELPEDFLLDAAGETIQLQEIEGCWVPEPLAASVPMRLAALSAELDNWTAAPDSPRAVHARKLLEAATRGLTALETVKDDPAAFDVALGALLDELTALIVGQKLRALFE